MIPITFPNYKLYFCKNVWPSRILVLWERLIRNFNHSCHLKGFTNHSSQTQAVSEAELAALLQIPLTCDLVEQAVAPAARAHSTKGPAAGPCTRTQGWPGWLAPAWPVASYTAPPSTQEQATALLSLLPAHCTHY